ncbi:MAG: hypothetical protein V2J20_02800 [Wenzhouxiangella sp.]|jgi:hypothetical protein|nr:hypothetical protein [Wenzhouxiangella sp.]
MPHQPIVHIGLGKTATTSLQRNVFPNIPNLRDGIAYNDKALVAQLCRRHFMTADEEKKFQDSIRLGKHFISLESLVDWNPRNWKVAAEQNLRLFGHETTIIITVRDTESYLCSVYQQMVHEGHVWNPVEFFVNFEEFERIAPLLPSFGLFKFDVDSFDLEILHKIYAEKFAKVVIVPLSSVNELGFMREIFNLNDGELEILKSKMKEGRTYNRSYSRRAMALTMKREKLLNSLGLMSYCSATQEIIFREDAQLHNELRELKFVGSFRGFPRFVMKRIIKELNWRNFIQRRFDRIFPYEKYSLPHNVYRNKELARKNDNFIKKFE